MEHITHVMILLTMKVFISELKKKSKFSTFYNTCMGNDSIDDFCVLSFWEPESVSYLYNPVEFSDDD